MKLCSRLRRPDRPQCQRKPIAKALKLYLIIASKVFDNCVAPFFQKSSLSGDNGIFPTGMLIGVMNNENLHSIASGTLNVLEVRPILGIADICVCGFWTFATSTISELRDKEVNTECDTRLIQP